MLTSDEFLALPARSRTAIQENLNKKEFEMEKREAKLIKKQKEELNNFKSCAKRAIEAIASLATHDEKDVEAINLKAREEKYQELYKADQELSAELDQMSFDTPSPTNAAPKADYGIIEERYVPPDLDDPAESADDQLSAPERLIQAHEVTGSIVKLLILSKNILGKVTLAEVGSDMVLTAKLVRFTKGKLHNADPMAVSMKLPLGCVSIVGGKYPGKIDWKFLPAENRPATETIDYNEMTEMDLNGHGDMCKGHAVHRRRPELHFGIKVECNHKPGHANQYNVRWVEKKFSFE